VEFELVKLKVEGIVVLEWLKHELKNMMRVSYLVILLGTAPANHGWFAGFARAPACGTVIETWEVEGCCG
jgi:hypothetical protein